MADDTVVEIRALVPEWCMGELRQASQETGIPLEDLAGRVIERNLGAFVENIRNGVLDDLIRRAGGTAPGPGADQQQGGGPLDTWTIGDK